MATKAKGGTRAASILTSLGEDKLILTALTGREEMSRLFEYRVDLLSERKDIKPTELLGTNAVIAIQPLVAANKSDDSPPQRYINGFFTSFSEAGAVATTAFGGDRGYLYRAVVSPLLWFATRRSASRTFADMKGPDVVNKVLGMYGGTIELRLGGDYKLWKYCAQYCETDFNFVSRVMEREGMYYYFEHSASAHKMVVMDGTSAHTAGPVDAVHYYGVEPGGTGAPLDELTVTTTAQPGKFRHREYDLYKMRVEESVSTDSISHGFGDLEIYDYPAEAADEVGADSGNALTARMGHYARVRMQELRARYRLVHGSGVIAGLETGRKVKVSGLTSVSQEHVVVASTLSFDVNDATTGKGGEFAPRTTFTAIDAKTAFRPQRLTPKPLIRGAQTALVASEPDQYGRVQLKFHWNEESTLPWVRVAQSMAGKQWGAVFIPRVGHEVVVEFIEGDPDRPLITGVVYNGIHKPPYALPAEKTKSTMKTSTWDGGGFNEIRFEDKTGSEQIFIHGQKQLDVRIKEDRLTYIGKETHLIVEENRYEKIKKDHHLKIEGDCNEEVTGIASLKAGQKIQYKAGTAAALDAGTEIHLKAGTNLILEAGVQISLKVGGSFVNIGPAGVDIVGPMVKVNSGGSAGSGAGSSPKAPTAPKEADKAEPGTKSEPPPDPQPPPATTYSPQALTIKQAAQSGAPLCEI